MAQRGREIDKFSRVDIKLARTDLWRLVAEDYSLRHDFFTTLSQLTRSLLVRGVFGVNILS